MTPLLVLQLRRVARNRQFLFFTVLLPALLTVFLSRVFAGAGGAASRRPPR